MKIKKLFILLVFISAIGIICAKPAAAQRGMTLTGVGSGEKVRLSAGGKSKVVKLEGTETGDFTAGGEPPHRYTTLLTMNRGDSFYLIAKFISGPAISDRNAPCGGDRPTTLLLIKTDKNLALENVQTEIFASCAFNGSGRYVKGRPLITKNKVSISFDEGSKKYTLLFNADEAEKGLQLISR